MKTALAFREPPRPLVLFLICAVAFMMLMLI